MAEFRYLLRKFQMEIDRPNDSAKVMVEYIEQPKDKPLPNTIVTITTSIRGTNSLLPEEIERLAKQEGVRVLSQPTSE